VSKPGQTLSVSLVLIHIGGGIFSLKWSSSCWSCYFHCNFVKKQNYLFFMPTRFLCSIKNVL